MICILDFAGGLAWECRPCDLERFFSDQDNSFHSTVDG